MITAYFGSLSGGPLIHELISRPEVCGSDWSGMHSVYSPVFRLYPDYTRRALVAALFVHPCSSEYANGKTWCVNEGKSPGLQKP